MLIFTDVDSKSTLWCLGKPPFAPSSLQVTSSLGDERKQTTNKVVNDHYTDRDTMVDSSGSLHYLKQTQAGAGQNGVQKQANLRYELSAMRMGHGTFPIIELRVHQMSSPTN